MARRDFEQPFRIPLSRGDIVQQEGADMTNPAGWLQPRAIHLNVLADRKAATLRILAAQLTAGRTFEVVFKALMHRESIGCTGLGHGVALPHARLPGLEAPTGTFFRMRPTVEFDAPDGEQVDLVIELLLPGEGSQHQLQLLAHIAGLMSEAPFRTALRCAENSDHVADLFAKGLP
jgi:PTS system nitrogen regulatory IIA component